MDKKMTPVEMVAREMVDHTEMPHEKLLPSIRRALTSLRKRAADEITRDDTSASAEDAALEYQAMSEMVNLFGAQLIALEDLNVADIWRVKN